MRTWMLIGAGAGAALLGYGLLRGIPELKGMQPLGAAPEDPNVLPKHDPSTIPTHTQQPDDEERANATYCQLLVAYRQDLRRYKTQQDMAKNRMDEALREAESICDAFAWKADWSYDYGFMGISGWTTLRKSRDPAVQTRCVEYVKGVAKDPGKPYIKPPPTAGANMLDGSWTAVASAIRSLKAQVESARGALPALRDKYTKAKKEYDFAGAKVADLKKKIKDLEVQGVYCPS